MLLCTSSSLMAEWLCYWTCNPETWVRFPEGMTSFYFTWNKNYTDTRSARGKMPFLFFSMVLYFFLSQPLQGQNLKKIYGTQKWQKTMENFRREFREHFWVPYVYFKFRPWSGRLRKTRRIIEQNKKGNFFS